ncbi:restriction endonuclease subunit S [uncultured Muribaculum sp.]|jgi:type I restriction enzyme S subunit|uniref:restriction endonuclease subunit S n=1 Tax=uncultured Muribaculum sp. TaxID=1918613 RepID=UPI002589D635|nr:restriction endonuclease subunit S [uncultured Muribaculum sp.]
MTKLSSIADYVTDKISSNDIALREYVTTDCILQNKKGREIATNLPPQSCCLTRYQHGDVLIANIRPYLKKVWFADIDGGASSDVLVFRAKEGHSPSFLYAVLLQDSFFDYVMQGAKGSKMPRGDKEQILRYEMPTLSCSEESIGTFFLNLDQKIRLNEQINQNLEAMAKQLYDYWFVQFDFPNEEGKPYKSSGGEMVWNEKLKRKIPNEWDNCKLKDFINLFDSKRIPLSSKDREERKGNYPYYGATGIMDYVNEYIFDGDYILLAEDGSTSDSKGFPIVQYIWGKNWVNNHAHIILPKNEQYLMFTYQMLRSIPAKQIETGSIQKKISQENLCEYNMVLPNSILIEKYESIISPLWEKRKLCIEEINALIKQRDELLPLLMNGQASVNSDLSHD